MDQRKQRFKKRTAVIKEKVSRVQAAQCKQDSRASNPPVSLCEPLCAILLALASVYPLSGVKAYVKRVEVFSFYAAIVKETFAKMHRCK